MYLENRNRDLHVLYLTVINVYGPLFLRKTPFLKKEMTIVPIIFLPYLLKSVFNEIRVTRSLVLCVCFVDRCLSLMRFVLLDL